MALTMTIDRQAETHSGKTLPAGTVGKYDGHVPGGMVRVIIDGVPEIVHPAAIKELRRDK